MGLKKSFKATRVTRHHLHQYQTYLTFCSYSIEENPESFEEDAHNYCFEIFRLLCGFGIRFMIVIPKSSNAYLLRVFSIGVIFINYKF